MQKDPELLFISDGTEKINVIKKKKELVYDYDKPKTKDPSINTHTEVP